MVKQDLKMQDVIIEKARDDDRVKIFELLEQANMHHIPSEEMSGLTYENYFVARLGGEVVGFSGYKVTGEKEAKTELMVVDRNCRGLGAGYKLQEKRMDDMLDKGMEILITNSDLPASIEWYKRKFGYKEIGRIKKVHEFGDPNIDEWTTLRVNLTEWNTNRKKT